MAISIVNKRGTNLIEVVVSGKLTHADYVEFSPQVERLVQIHGKVRMLLDMIDFHGWEPAAVWDDARFSYDHFGDITHIAMVGDHTWERLLSKMCALFTKAKVRYFDWKALKEAHAWLEQPLKDALREATMPVQRSKGKERAKHELAIGAHLGS